jgi:hypothetical protein
MIGQYFSHSRLVWVFTSNAGVKIPDRLHINFNISGWSQSRAKAGSFAPIINKPHDDGDSRTLGNVIKTGFPSPDFLASAFRRDSQNQLLAAAEQFD